MQSEQKVAKMGRLRGSVSRFSTFCPLLRTVSAVINLVLGVIPGLVLFFEWVEQGCAIPSQWNLLHWPWVEFTEFNLLSKCGWNMSIFLIFGGGHSILAQKSVQKMLDAWIPPQGMRTLYIVVTGLSLIGVMGFWQPTEIQVWRMPLSSTLNSVISFILFWICMLTAGKILTRFGVFEFLGLKQLWMKSNEIERTEGTSQLLVSGLYRWVRHPVYTLTLAAFLLTPVMTLDRLLISFATCLYLVFGIPMEERKLIRQFGGQYLSYRNEVPSVIPFLKAKKVI